MKNMSFSLTTKQMRDGTKTVTRRLGWTNLRPGDRVCAVVKGAGLKKGERVERIREIEIVSNTKETVAAILDRPADTMLEGFVGWNSTQFIDFFCKHNHCLPSTVVNRIEFKYV